LRSNIKNYLHFSSYNVSPATDFERAAHSNEIYIEERFIISEFEKQKIEFTTEELINIESAPKRICFFDAEYLEEPFRR